MSINNYGASSGMGMGMGMSQQAGGQYTTTTTTGLGSLNYPLQPTPTWQYPYPPAVEGTPPFSYNHPMGTVGIFRVRKVENGYLVEFQLRTGEQIKEYYAETLKDVGERIAALGVQKVLEGDQKAQG